MTSLPLAPLWLPTRPPEVLHPRFRFSHLQAPQTNYLHSQDLLNISGPHVELSPVHVSLGHMCHFFQEAELGVTSESHLPHPLALCGSAHFLAYVAVSYSRLLKSRTCLIRGQRPCPGSAGLTEGGSDGSRAGLGFLKLLEGEGTWAEAGRCSECVFYGHGHLSIGGWRRPTQRRRAR